MISNCEKHISIVSRSGKELIKNFKLPMNWGIECLDKLEMKKIHINYGQLLVFNQNLLHKTPMGEDRISLQLRYEQINSKFKKRTVSQIVDPKIRKYWSRKIKR